MKRIFVLVPILFCAFSSLSRADDNSKPCELQSKAAMDAVGTSGYAEAQKIWMDCQAFASEKQKAEWVATRHTWAASLDSVPQGGWILLTLDTDGTFAIFGSQRHATRQGNVVAVWLRYEFRESKFNSNERYMSDVQRAMYDCGRIASKVVAITYYSGNNLESVGSSYTYEEAKVAWSPAIPGTIGDSLLDWACKAVLRAQPTK